MATIIHPPRPSTGHVSHLLLDTLAVIAGIFLALHGIAHILGFLTQWDIRTSKDLPYITTVLYGNVDVGDVGIRIEGLLWLLAAAGFVVVGLRLAWLRRVEVRPLLAVTVFSLALCVLGLPAAVVGVWIDIAVMLALGLVVVLRRRQSI